MSERINQAGYAKLHNVSRKTVTQWKSRGWLVFDGDLIDVVASNDRLKRYRSAGVTSVTGTVTQEVTGNTPKEIEDGESAAEAATRIISISGADMDMDEAKRVKENYLALLNQLDYEQKSKALIPIVDAQNVLFSEFRAQRDAWLNWPLRIGPMMAADLDLPSDKIVEVLTKYVHEHISALGDPESNFEQD